MNYILAIESSCDETAASVLKDGCEIISSVIASQVAIHREYGGIVPELASRHHLNDIGSVVRSALEEAGIAPAELSAICATQGPGLVGSLVVGFSFAKAMAVALGIPFTGVNHVSAHLLSIFLGQQQPDFPFIGLVVSGGHTSLYRVESFLSVELIGHTRDDAAGEAFDKVAKLLGLGYPGGPVISQFAEKGDKNAFLFPKARLLDDPYGFSFSGVKTAVRTALNRLSKEQVQQAIPDICASFQRAVVETLVSKTLCAAKAFGMSSVVVAGGVAANKALRYEMGIQAQKAGIQAFFPSPEFCTDNAAMVAIAGYHQLKAGSLAKADADVYSKLLC